MSHKLISLSQSFKKPLNISAELLPLAKGTKPLEVFSLFAQQPWAMWLDSCQSDHVDSRFDIMVWQPKVTLTTFGQNTHIKVEQSQQSEVSKEDPLSILKSLQKQVIADGDSTLLYLPFIGGSLGYFSYDLGRRFEKLPEVAKQDINLPDMAVGIYSQAIIFDNKTNQYFLSCSDDKREQLQADIINQLTSFATKENKNSFQLTCSWQSNMDKASYIEKFKQVQEYLLSGDCYQINLAQRFSANYQGDEFDAYLALRAENKAPFSSFIRLESSAILSVSPERFLQLSNGKVQTKPIKGTMPRSENAVIDKENAEILAASSKDRAENLMIVDLLRNDVSKSCQAGSVKVPKLFDIESFPAVHHLVSTIEAKLAEDKDATDLLRGAFPGGSITGAPKIRAMEIIEELEPHRRSVYCGSIGYISSCGTMDTSITIRTLICQQGGKITDNSVTSSMAESTIHCWAGGGLVADSKALSEYQETFDKVNRILPVLSKLNS